MDPSLLGRPIPTPVAQKPASRFSPRLIAIAFVIVAALVGGFLMLASSSDNSKDLMHRLGARQATTLKLIGDGQKNLNSDQLTKINSELNLILISDNAALETEITGAGIKKLDKEVVAAEADTETFEKLASAKLNGQYDATYKTVLTQKLESLRALLRELHDKTKSKSLKTVLANEYQHLTTYSDELEKLASN
jgi:hypothetical protein